MLSTREFLPATARGEPSALSAAPPYSIDLLAIEIQPSMSAWATVEPYLISIVGPPGVLMSGDNLSLALKANVADHGNYDALVATIATS